MYVTYNELRFVLRDIKFDTDVHALVTELLTNFASTYQKC